MAKKHPFIMVDESENIYGFHVNVAGIDIDKAFKNNPIGFYAHTRSDEASEFDDGLPKVKWSDVVKLNGSMKGSCEFDQNDALATKLESKVEGGFINCVSVTLKPLSVAERYNKTTDSTEIWVEESILLECSLADIPGNFNAIKLIGPDGNEIKLSAGKDAKLALSELLKLKSPNNMSKLTQFIVALAMSADATEDQVHAEVVKLVSNHKTAAAKITQLETELESIKAEKIELVLKNAIDCGKISEAQKPIYLVALKSDFVGTEKQLNEMVVEGAAASNPVAAHASVVNTVIKQNAGNLSKTDQPVDNKYISKYDELSRVNGGKALVKLKAENTVEFKKLLDEHLIAVKNKYNGQY